jgi:hypothetical protein
MPSTLPKIVSKPANWHSDRHGVTPKFIVAHGTAGIDSVAYLQRGGEKKDGSDRKVSIHVLIAKDGTIYRMVPDERVANHAGYGRVVINGKTYQSDGVNCNVASLGFELENLQNGKDPYSRNQLLSMGLVIGSWREKYTHLPIVRHGDIDPRRRKDPVGLSVLEIEQWVAEASVVFSPSIPSREATDLLEQRWSLWGQKHPLDRAARGFGTPKLWYANADKLGAATTTFTYDDLNREIVFFERGLIIWTQSLGGRVFLL